MVLPLALSYFGVSVFAEPRSTDDLSAENNKAPVEAAVTEAGNGNPVNGNGNSLGGVRKKLAESEPDLRRAAAALLFHMVDKARAEENDPARDFLVQVLTLESLVSGEVPWLSALTVLEESALWISRERDLPFAQFGTTLVPLFGIGSDEFRHAVVRAVQQVVNVERAKMETESVTLTTVRERLVGSTPPTVALFRDCVRTLWAVDPHACVDGLIEALISYSGMAPSAAEPADGDSATSSDETGQSSNRAVHPLTWVALDELRTRFPIDFPSAMVWQQWWTEVRSQPITTILEDCEKRSIVARVETWRALMEKLRTTEDADLVLLVIQDYLERHHGVELRLAIVDALARYARWVEEVGLPAEDASEQKARFLGRGVTLILDVIERDAYPLETPEVIRAALVALQRYRGYLEKTSAYKNRVREVIVGTLEELAGVAEDKPRAIYFEAMRAAGVLRVEAALPHVESLLRLTAPENEGDLPLLTQSVSTLSRLVVEPGMSMEMAELLIRLFGQHVEVEQETARNFRRACMTALSEATGNVNLRSVLLKFYHGILVDGGDATLRVPAILGLGKLVQAKQEGALESLVDVLDERYRYAPEEVRAAVDCIASFATKEAALAEFTRLLPVEEREVQEQLRSKVQGLVESDGIPMAALASERLVSLALESGRRVFFEKLIEVLSAPPVEMLLDPKKVAFDDVDKVVLWWSTVIRRLRVYDLLGDDEKVGELTAAIVDLVEKNATLKEKIPNVTNKVSSLAQSLETRKALLKKLVDVTVAPPLLVAEFETLWSAEASPLGRCCQLTWWQRHLAGLSDLARLGELKKHSLGAFAAERHAELWKDIPTSFRERYVARVGGTQPAPPKVEGSKESTSDRGN